MKTDLHILTAMLGWLVGAIATFFLFDWFRASAGADGAIFLTASVCLMLSVVGGLIGLLIENYHDR